MDGENGLICAYALNGDGGATPAGFGILVTAQAGLAVFVVLIFHWLRWM